MVGATAGKIGTMVPSWRLSAWMHVYSEDISSLFQYYTAKRQSRRCG